MIRAATPTPTGAGNSTVTADPPPRDDRPGAASRPGGRGGDPGPALAGVAVVDVTSQLDGLKDVSPLEGELFPSPGRVRYDPRELENPRAPLGPGEHEARVELVEVPEFGAQGQVVDQYAWSFEVQ